VVHAKIVSVLDSTKLAEKKKERLLLLLLFHSLY